jgi:hypothetical protein
VNGVGPSYWYRTSQPWLPKSSISSSVALEPFLGPGLFFSYVNFFTHMVGLLGRVISPSQGRYLHTGQHKHRINGHTDIHALSGIRTHDPSVWASEDGSCLRPGGHCDRPKYIQGYKSVEGRNIRKRWKSWKDSSAGTGREICALKLMIVFLNPTCISRLKQSILQHSKM